MQKPLVIQAELDTPIYLPEASILAIKKSLDAKRRLYEKLPSEIEALSKRYEAAMLFAPPNFDPEQALEKESEAPVKEINVVTLPPPATRKVAVKRKIEKTVKPIGWRKGLQIILEGAEDGLSHQPLLTIARDTYKFPPSVGEKGFYNAIAKLINAGAVVKHGNILFSSNIYTRRKGGGTLPVLQETQRRAGSSAELIYSALEAHPEGLTGPGLKTVVSAMPGAPKSLREHAQYVYNILGAMMGSGEVIKTYGVYRLAVLGDKK